MDGRGFDLWADGYDASVAEADAAEQYPFAGYGDVLSAVYDAVRGNGAQRVLDVGFGTGALAGRFYDDGLAVTGIDFSARMVEIARERMPGAALIAHDFANGLPDCLDGQAFDAIVSTYALHHLPDAAKVGLLRDLYRHLQPGGVLVVGDVSFETPRAREIAREAAGGEWDEEEFYYSYTELRPMLPVPSRYAQVSFCAGVLALHRPRMVMFDFGETLSIPSDVDYLRGMRAAMAHATQNPAGVSAEEVFAFGEAEFRALDAVRLPHAVEVHEHAFMRFQFEYFGLAFDQPIAAIERAYWDGAMTMTPTPGTAELLAALDRAGIRTGVISNIMYSGEALAETIRRLLPDHTFEFIIATSEYVYRKPHRYIFELALRKAGLAARDVWYCGDSFEMDVMGATGAGIDAIWYTPVPDGREAAYPCAAARDWARLTAWLG